MLDAALILNYVIYNFKFKIGTPTSLKLMLIKFIFETKIIKRREDEP